VVLGMRCFFESVSLSATSSQSGLSYVWEQVGGPVGVTADISAENSATTDVQVGVAGNYLFRVTGSNGEFSASDTVLVEVFGNAVVEITSPEDGGSVTDGGVIQVGVNAYQDGRVVSGVDVYNGTTLLGAATRLSGSVTWVYDIPSASVGDYALKAVASISGGGVAESAVVNFTVVDFDEAALVLQIDDPVDSQLVSSRYMLRGTAFSDFLESWSLEIREEGGDWRVVHTSSEGVVDGDLVEFDPSLLENGVYELRLGGVTSVGTSGFSGVRRVVVEGDLKIGHFALAFEDLSIPVTGIPLSVTRTYMAGD